jgi:hypothetical protein
MTPQTARLVLGLVAPAVFAVGSAGSLLVGVAVGGCASEETAQAGSVLGPPTVEAELAPTVSRYSKEESLGAGYTKTLAATSGVFAGLGASHAGAATTLDSLLAAGNQGGAWPLENNGLCPPDMASIDDRFCVDRYEASLVEVLADGTERPFSPYESVQGHTVRAISEAGVYPQGYISEVQAIQACSLSGKRLCRAKEWRKACMGPEHKTYGYADKSEPGKCNDHGRSPMGVLFANENLAPRQKWDWERMNRPELNQIEGTLAPTGEHDGCTNGYGVYDMVGNLHEWVDDPNGTFQGGYYQDTTINGEGCQYVTMAHEARYHDYSTGFRCCADVAP